MAIKEENLKPWNHDADNWKDSAGVDVSRIDKILHSQVDKLVDDDENPSVCAENIEKALTKREMVVSIMDSILKAQRSSKEALLFKKLLQVL